MENSLKNSEDMGGNNLTIVKTNTRLHRTSIADPFSHYKPEDEAEIRKSQPALVNRAVALLEKAFQQYSFGNPSKLSEMRRSLDRAEALVKRIHCTSKDITDFSIAISQFEHRDDFSESAGVFLSALINSCKEKEFLVVTRHLSKRLDYFGYFNCKDVTVDGDLGESVGRQNSGTIHMNGCFVFTDVPNYNEPGKIYHKGKIIDPKKSWNRALRKMGFKV